jgi:hypothetical protein
MMLKIKDKNFWCTVLLLTTIFFIGFILGKLIEVPFITIEKNINPLHALSILVTLLVALVISVFFQKNKDINNTANDIIIKRVDKIVDMLDILNESILEGSIEVIKAPAISKRIYSSLKCVNQSLIDYSISISATFDSIEQKHRLIKDLLTNTPAHNGNDAPMPVKVENEKYVYTSARISEIERNIEDLKNSLYKTQLEINKSFRTW